ncbi:MAG: hypothetical protein JNK05_27005 [Myxococcales bacterium]|nr:hypothetical protein [Myxococcales bacterium]
MSERVAAAAVNLIPLPRTETPTTNVAVWVSAAPAMGIEDVRADPRG